MIELMIETVKRSTPEEIAQLICKMTDETKRLRSLATDLLDMVEIYHACEWDEEPFTPDLDELHKRLDTANA